MRRKIIIHNHLPARDLQYYAGDVIWTDVSEAEYQKLRPGDSIMDKGLPAIVVEIQ